MRPSTYPLRLFRSIIDTNRKSTMLMIQSTRSLYEQTRSGSVDFENKKRAQMNETQRLKETTKMMKKDLKWAWQIFKDATFNAFRADVGTVAFDDNQLIKIWDFNQRNNEKLSSYSLEFKSDKLNDMNNWLVTCDADYDVGFSKCSWTVSPSGHALFSGYLDTTVPKDGKTVRTGYAFLSSQKSRHPFNLPTDGMNIFEQFTHVILRVRGDGRMYQISFDTADVFDITWFDRYNFMMYTFGGPYWQYVKIPLSRFYFHYQGFIQDEQYQFNPNTIRSMGIMVHSPSYSGPFRLEIDYIGFVNDCQHNDLIEYEGYYHESSQLKST
ncbi:complex I intermediate-associated protein 30 [Dermatophagoides farinae]|uniref:complex I intermediate-associated protein 30 n=1 Tax=Dermatophagoides farinae TaxID=6954 RepID=UPI003F5F72E9